jgi:NAD(P)H-dependent FMN reductase
MAVLRTAQLVAPKSVAAVVFTGLGELPLFNPDADEDPLDPRVADLRAQIRAADALVFSTPEYARALPGAFKNLLDWTVGDEQPGSIYEKPVGWVNVSPRGAPNAYESLRRVLGYVKATVVDAACLHIPVMPDMLDEELIPDPSVQAVLALALGELESHIGRRSFPEDD